ncbi:KilA-N domain-containing protein [Neisseria flavescens]|uniref:KilA-N domain protein n=1 Tax=Neisseria flavescens NRL30031/H210 TaxID=546264 RepID=C0EN32_NEIFL|nr:KilA-N domain-containing protein [Neisseria flavescens]SPY04748.1 putative phage related protein [Neisseria meningitidis]EEG33654.1 KilA-N domain protein [Neisseria flavescens NRL30031/H210]QCL69028.1 KilA-N domain-containing protein [Neisseria flavescens]SPY10446.1 putative phage related protein [Neisseria meningitidis]STZ64961.1 putative phage related protein [Neisseria flavescens]
MSIQTISFNQFSVSFQENGYLNATAIAEQYDKRVGNYLRNERTQEYIAALNERLFNPETRNRVTAENQLVIIRKGGNDKKSQGTWLHPKLAVDFARWLNPKFAVWCDEQIEALLNKVSDGIKTVTPKPPRALPNGLTGEQIEAVKKLHNALTKSAPKEAQARIAITLWSAVKSKFGCSYKEVPAEQFPEVLSVMSRVAVENGVLYGEVLDREPLPAPQPALLDGLDIERFAVTVYYGTWALEMLKEVALPLRQLGHPKAATMYTLWNESRSFLRYNIQALQRVLPALEPDHAAHVRGTLDRLKRLNARFI